MTAHDGQSGGRGAARVAVSITFVRAYSVDLDGLEDAAGGSISATDPDALSEYVEHAVFQDGDLPSWLTLLPGEQSTEAYVDEINYPEADRAR